MKNIVFVAVFALILAGCGSGLKHHMALNDKDGFDTIYDPALKELKIANWNEPYILFFFTTMCGACTAQVPALNELVKEYGSKIKVIGVMGNSLGFDGDMTALKDKGVEFMSVSTKKSVDYFSNIVGGIMGTPVTYVFDKNGKISKQFLGLYPKSALENELKLLLN